MTAIGNSDSGIQNTEMRLSQVKGWTISLWVVQVLLAFAIGGAGVMKTFFPIPELAAMLKWPGDVPVGLVRFIGVAELSAAFGMLLPALTRIRPGLTPLAALGFIVIQLLAIPFHASRGELAITLPLNLTFLALSGFVLWGRWKKAPITPRHLLIDVP